MGEGGVVRWAGGFSMLSLHGRPERTCFQALIRSGKVHGETGPGTRQILRKLDLAGHGRGSQQAGLGTGGQHRSACSALVGEA